MVTVNQDVKMKYKPFDGCYGIVTERNRTGAYLKLDNEEEAFAYRFANLLPGSLVLCTVLRKATATKRMLVTIDSVIEYAEGTA